MYGKEKNVLYWADQISQNRIKISSTGPTSPMNQPRRDPCHDKPNEPTKEGPLSFVLTGSPFTSVSTVSRGHPSLVSLLSQNLNVGESLALVVRVPWAQTASQCSESEPRLPAVPARGNFLHFS